MENGRTVVVTGANAGIGKAMSRQLVEAGHRVAMVCRSEDKGLAAREEIASGLEDADVSLHVADLGRRGDLDRVAAELVDELGEIDVLLHNAGVQMNKRYETDEGLELMFAVNHVAPHVLTARLLDALAGDARVVTVSSAGHSLAKPDLDDLQCARSFGASRQYCNTKLYNIWFTRELDRRLPDVTASCFHPGAVATGWAQDDPGFWNVMMKMVKPFLRSPERAARTGVLLAVDEAGADAGGQYWVDEKPTTPSKLARDDEAAARLFAIAEELTGLSIP